MKTYIPDKFVIIKIDNHKEIYKVVGEWSCRFLNGGSWRINSGIKYYTQKNDTLSLYSHSGSVYNVNVESEGISSTMIPLLSQIGASVIEWDLAKHHIEEKT